MRQLTHSEKTKQSLRNLESGICVVSTFVSFMCMFILFNVCNISKYLYIGSFKVGKTFYKI